MGIADGSAGKHAALSNEQPLTSVTPGGVTAPSSIAAQLRQRLGQALDGGKHTHDDPKGSARGRTIPNITDSVQKLRDIQRITHNPSATPADPVRIRLNFADNGLSGLSPGSEVGASPDDRQTLDSGKQKVSIRQTLHIPVGGTRGPASKSSNAALQTSLPDARTLERAAVDTGIVGPSSPAVHSLPFHTLHTPPVAGQHTCSNGGAATTFSNPLRSSSSPLKHRLQRLTAAAQSAARAASCSSAARGFSQERDIPGSRRLSQLGPLSATPSHRTVLADMSYSSRNNLPIRNAFDVATPHPSTPMAINTPMGKQPSPGTARAKRLTAELQELRASAAAAAAEKARMEGEVARARAEAREAQEEVGRLSAARTAAEVARADAQMARKALQKEREWRQQLSETLTKRERDAAEAAAASETVHHKARQLERHTHEAVEEAAKWKIAAEGLQQQVLLIPRLESKVRELEGARTLINQLEERLQAETSARCVAEATGAAREAALAAAQRQLAVQSGSAEAHMHDAHAHNSLLETSLQESREQAHSLRQQLAQQDAHHVEELRRATIARQEVESRLLSCQVEIKELESRMTTAEARTAEADSHNLELSAKLATREAEAQEAKSSAAASEAHSEAVTNECAQQQARAESAEAAWRQEAQRADVLERDLVEAREAAAAAHESATKHEIELKEKTAALAALESEGTQLCQKVEQLLGEEEEQRERAGQLAAALEAERSQRDALEGRLEESRTLLAAQQAQLRQMQQASQRAPATRRYAGGPDPKAVERLQRELHAAVQQRDSLTADVAHWQREAEVANRAEKKLLAQLENLKQKGNAGGGDEEGLRAEFAKARRALEEQIEQRDEAAEAMASTLDSLRMDLAAREAQLEIFQAKLKAARAQAPSSAKPPDTDRLSTALAEAEQSAASLAERLEGEIAAHAICAADKEGLAAQLQQLLAEKQRLAAACTQLATEHEAIMSELDLLRAEARRRQAEADALQARVAVGRDAAGKVKALEVEVTALRTRAAQTIQLEAQLKNVRGELLEAGTKSASLEKAHEALEKACEQLQQELARAKQEAAALEEEAKTLRPLRTYASHIQALERQLEDKEAKLAKVRAEAGQAGQAAAAAAKLRESLAEKEGLLAAALEEAHAWEDRAAGAEATAARVPGLEATIRDREALVDSLRAELEEALRCELEEAAGKAPLSLQAARAQAATLSKEKAALQVELDTRTAAAREVEAQLRKVEAARQTLAAQIDELTSLLNAAAAQVPPAVDE